jgi:hypothetical protein
MLQSGMASPRWQQEADADIFERIEYEMDASPRSGSIG